MAKALKIVAAVTAIAALAVVTGGAALGLGLSLATTAFGVSASSLLIASAVLSAGASLLSPKPKVPTTSGATSDRLQVSVDLRTGRKIVFGRTAMATDLRDQEWSTDQSYLDRFVVVASHKVNSIQEIWFDDKQAWTSAGGVTAAYAGYLTVTPILEGSAANAIYTSARMGSGRRFTGCAYVRLRYKLTGNNSKAQSPFSGSVPSRVTIIGEGATLYDPRLDSLVGGAGAQRANDQTTWTWNLAAARNPALAMLWYLLGWRIQNPVTGEWKLAVGKGLPSARIDIASFITAANICDEPVATPGGGTEPRYCCDGIFSETDDTGLVLDNLKAAMNAVLDDVDGKIRVTVLHNDLAAPIGKLTAADVLGEFTWLQSPPLNDSINVIRGGYTDPSTTSLYQLVDAPEVRIDSPDGIDRAGQPLNMAVVQSASQWQRLAKQRLQRALYGGTFTAVFQASAWKFQKGDVVQFDFFPLGFASKLFRIADMTIQTDGVVPMMLREEHPDIYAAYSDASAPIVGTAPTIYDPSLWPVIQGIVDVATAATAAQAAADAARTAAAAAAENASASLAQLSIIQSDGYLSAGEKPDIIRQWNDIDAEHGPIYAKAAALGLSTGGGSEADAYAVAYQSLRDYLLALAPAYNDTAHDTAVVPATFNGRFSSYYFARTTLLNAMAARAAQTALWEQVSGTGKDALIAQAADAQAKANSSQAALSIIAADNYLSAGEKPDLIREVQVVVAEQPVIYAKAAALGLSTAGGTAADTYGVAYSALASYLNGLSPAYTSTTTDTAIVPNTFRGKFGDYYAARTALINAMAERAGQTALWDSVTGGGKEALIAQAADAQAKANSAQSALSIIAADNYMSAGEKPDVIREFQVIAAEQPVIYAKAAALGLSTGGGSAADTYAYAFQQLQSYLNGLAPAYTSTTTDTPIVGTTFRGKFADYYGARTALLTAMTGAAALTSTWSGTANDNGAKPADNATRNQVTYSTTAPGSPVNGDIWVDLNGAYAVVKLRSGGVWQVGATALSAYNQLPDRPFALADINTVESSKLAGIADNATRNQVTYSTTAPGSPVNGDIWVDLNGAYAVVKLRSGGLWQVGATALSAYNQLPDRPFALADINTIESAKLTGIANGAGTSLTLIAGGPQHVVGPGNAFTRNGSGWPTNGDTITSRESYPFAVVSGQFVAGGSEVLFGLSDDINGRGDGQVYGFCDYAWYRAGSTVYPYYFLNTEPTSGGHVFAAGSVDYGATYAVTNDGVTVTWTKNGAVVASMAAVYLDGRAYRFIGIANGTGGMVVNIQLSPYNSDQGKQLLDKATGRALNRRILSMATSGGVGQVYSINPLSAATTSGGVATITIAAHSVQDDAGTVNYSGGSIGGLAASTSYVVYEDGAYAGGARTYVASTDFNVLTGSPDRRWVGTIVTPAAGGTGSGGDVGGGGRRPVCVDEDSWLPGGMQARDVRPGHRILALDYADMDRAEWVEVRAVGRAWSRCSEVELASGERLIVSDTTDLTFRDGSVARVGGELVGRVIAGQRQADRGPRWECIVAIEDAGWRWVIAIDAGGVTFAAGAARDAWVYSHNKPVTAPDGID